MQKAKVVKNPEGRFYQIGDEKMIFRLTAADTEGRHSVIERTIAPHFKSPPRFSCPCGHRLVLLRSPGSVGVFL